MLAELMRDSGDIIALDRTEAKAAAVRGLAEVMGLSCIKAYALDSTTLFQKDEGWIRPAGVVREGEGEVAGGKQGLVADQQQQKQRLKVKQMKPRSQSEGSWSSADTTAIMTSSSSGAESCTSTSNSSNGCSASQVGTSIASGLPFTRHVVEGGDKKCSSGSSRSGTKRRRSSNSSNGSRTRTSSSSSRSKLIGAGLSPGSFDHVLLDAPCSALGLRPRLLLSWDLHQLQQLAAYQRALLHSAVHMLKPGGTMVYCTCTINPGEAGAEDREI